MNALALPPPANYEEVSARFPSLLPSDFFFFLPGLLDRSIQDKDEGLRAVFCSLLREEAFDLVC